MRYFIPVLFLLVILAACSSADPESPETNDALDELDAPFAAIISGDVEMEITGTGYYACLTGQHVISNKAPGNTDLNNVVINIEPDTVTGTHSISTAQINVPVSAYFVNLPDNGYYRDNVSGSLELTAIATQPGEQIAGTFSFSAQRTNGETINIVGQFDFTVPNDFTPCN